MAATLAAIEGVVLGSVGPISSTSTVPHRLALGDECNTSHAVL
jgi:hypothetical protein